MKNKKFICIIAILCIITCALSIVLTACNKTDNTPSDEIKKYITSNGLLNFDEIPDSALAGEKITADQWKEALKESNFDNVTVYWLEDDFDLTLTSTSGYFKFDFNTKIAEEKYRDLSEDLEYTCITTETNNGLYMYDLVIDDNQEEGWYKHEVDDEISTDFKNYVYKLLDDPGDPTIFMEISDRFREFTYQDGFYCADKVFIEFFNSKAIYWYNVKFSFENGKLKMFSYEDKYWGEATDTITFVYTDYGTTKINLPENYTEYNEEDN